MGGVFHVLENVEELLELIGAVNCVENIKIAYVVAETDGVILFGLRVDGAQGTDEGLFYFGHPEAVEVAVGVYGQRSLVGKGEAYGGL